MKSIKGKNGVYRRHDKGFTLLEVMVALAVVGILLVGLLQTLNYHLDVASQHEARTVTMLLASQKLTEIREEPAASEGDFDEPYQNYHFKAEIGDSKYPGVGYMTVTVTGNSERAQLRELFRIIKDKLTETAAEEKEEADQSEKAAQNADDSENSSGEAGEGSGEEADTP